MWLRDRGTWIPIVNLNGPGGLPLAPGLLNGLLVTVVGGSDRFDERVVEDQVRNGFHHKGSNLIFVPTSSPLTTRLRFPLRENPTLPSRVSKRRQILHTLRGLASRNPTLGIVVAKHDPIVTPNRSRWNIPLGGTNRYCTATIQNSATRRRY